MSKCLRCGHCCMAVGREFWLHGDYSRYPELLALSEIYTDTDDGLPCRMLQMIDGMAFCKIQIEYGYKAKPKICRQYPEVICHHQLKNFTGQGVCLKESG